MHRGRVGFPKHDWFNSVLTAVADTSDLDTSYLIVPTSVCS